MRFDEIRIYHVAMPLIEPWITSYGSDYEIHSVLTNLKSSKPTYGLSKSDVTNQNKPANSSEADNEFELPNFITKSFVERLTI